jgi:hypothetical protein
MFSNSTEGDMFTAARCSRCIHAYEGDQLCDEAAVILLGEDPPDFLRRVPLTPANPVGVECDRFERTT